MTFSSSTPVFFLFSRDYRSIYPTFCNAALIGFYSVDIILIVIYLLK